ncbi:efflux RND transporter periplasmic adaptor subunit [Oceanicoccus sp. KOV_DT_Chl]|uniref:efflux RND transporter periplasmic adaptor subunit n=1 Tax=Oceanicoccus sp. KOV_DT_Chl TaxID=1904639 RepID=UPI000C7E3F50|nr:efflux RND transporter periplasmic adaptor subunit [Oceanicoccus sp. KOV_DT_Chl]
MKNNDEKNTAQHAIISTLLLALSAGLTACNDAEVATTTDSPAAKAITVQTQTLAAQSWQGEVNTYGVVEAAEEINLSLDFSAIVEQVLVNEAQAVKKGQLLITFDQEKRQLQFNQASENALQTQAALDEAYLMLERRKSLAANDTVSKEILDNAELALNRAQAQHREATAARKLAQRELNDSKLFSPVNGVIDIKAVEAGENITAGSTLLTLQAIDTLRVKTWVSEKDIRLIRSGAEATITLSGLPDQPLPSIVESVGVNADANTGNFPVKLILEQRNQLIRPGMTAQVAIKGVVQENLLMLPEAAVVDRDRKRVVFVVNTNTQPLTALRKEPLLSVGMGNQIVVLSGLEPGVQVIVDAQDKIINGSAIVVSP